VSSFHVRNVPGRMFAIPGTPHDSTAPHRAHPLALTRGAHIAAPRARAKDQGTAFTAFPAPRYL